MTKHAKRGLETGGVPRVPWERMNWTCRLGRYLMPLGDILTSLRHIGDILKNICEPLGLYWERQYIFITSCGHLEDILGTSLWHLGDILGTFIGCYLVL